VSENEVFKACFAAAVIRHSSASLDRLSHPAYEGIIGVQLKNDVASALIPQEFLGGSDARVKFFLQWYRADLVIDTLHEGDGNAIDFG